MLTTHVKSVLALAVCPAALSAAQAQAQTTTPAAPGATGEVQQAANEGGGVEEIIVTARRQEERLQDVPVAITAFSQRTLVENQVTSEFALARIVPGLTVNTDSGNAGLPQFSIRGRGQQYGAAAGSVETYFADVPLSPPFESPTLPPQFFDVGSFQVLKGPQGTLFGRSTTGGAVVIVPQAPKLEITDGYVRLQGGIYGNIQVEGAANLPLGEEAALRVAAFHWSRDGYMTALASDPTGDPILDSLTGRPLGKQRYNSVNTTQVRASLLVEPTDKIRNTLIFSYVMDQSRSSSSAGLNLIPGLPGNVADPRGVFLSPGYKSRDNYISLSLRKPVSNIWALINTTSIALSDDIEVKNIFGYIKGEGYTNDGVDADGTALGSLDVYVPVNPRRNRQLTDELQFQGKSFGGLLDWTLGGLLDRTRQPGPDANDSLIGRNAVAFISTGLPAGITPVPGKSAVLARFQQSTLNSEALYAAGTLHIMDGLNLPGGFRHSWDEVRAAQQAAIYPSIDSAPIPQTRRNFARKFQSDVYNVGLDYKISPDAMIYGGYRRGFKRGGFNTSVVRASTESFNPETIQDFYLGAKTDLRMGGVAGHFNIEGFYDNYKGYQVTYLEFGPGGAGDLATITTNVPKTRFKGFEAELSINPANWLDLYGSYSLTDAKFTSWTDTTVPGVTSPPLSVNDVPFNSRYKAVASARIHGELGSDQGELALKATYTYQSAFYTTPFDVRLPAATIAAFGLDINQKALGGATVPGYSLLDLRLEWNRMLGSKIDAAFNVSNVTNKFYFTGNSGTLNFGVQADSYGMPRMFNFELSTHF